MSDQVLVVEDEHDVSFAIRTLLTRAGFDVQVAHTGRAGVQEFDTIRPDAVVLDVGLPDLDGWQVLERIRDISTRPVLLLTAHGTDADKVRGLHAGADDYLTKPFSNSELIARVQALIRRSRAVPDSDPNCVRQTAELREAITAGQIVAYYQPIVRVCDRQVLGAEALARWVHPDRGLIPPDDFIGLAEQADLIGLLGEQVLRQACRDAASWPTSAEFPGKITVNVSGQQLSEAGFVPLVHDALACSGLAPSRLVLEVTESTVAGDDPVSQLALVQLRAAGVRVAIDDFGTGYSNLSRLATLPVDLLKLDRSFMRVLEHDRRSRALLRGLIAMARELELTTVVEGIETEELAVIIDLFGADEGQGWLYGRPCSADRFAAQLAG